MTSPPLASSYPANVLVVVLALFPGLINTAALGLLAPTMAHDLRMTPAAIGIVPLLSDAALAFGCILAAEVVRRNDGLQVYWWLMGASVVTSTATATATSAGVLIAASIVHGLIGGMLFITVLPPLLLNFKSAKLGETATVLVPSLFGAATLGPVVAALVAAPERWRVLFGAEAAVAASAIGLAIFTFAPRPASDAHAPVDGFALVFAALGSLLTSIGVGQLAQHDWTAPVAFVPVALGLACFLVLLIGEYRKRDALVPIAPLLSSLALVGAIATIAGSVCFTASLEALQLTLLRLHGFSARQAGLTLWPMVLSAFAAGIVYGRAVTTKWVSVVGLAGLAVAGLAALLAIVRAPLTPAGVAWLSILVGLGSGLSVTPGLFLVALAFERAIVARAIAMLEMLRLNAGFVSVPGVEHTLGTLAGGTDRARAFVTGSASGGAGKAELQAALAGGVEHVFAIVAIVAGVAIVASITVLVHARVRLRAPDLARFDEGKAALASPEVPLIAAATS